MYRVKYKDGSGSIQTVKKSNNYQEAQDFAKIINKVLCGKTWVEYRGKRMHLNGAQYG